MALNGDVLSTQEWKVNVTDLVRYAWVSGDINPIHFNQAAAEELGLPGTIVHGLFAHAKLVAELARVSREQKLGKLVQTNTKFASMMPAPGTYTLQVSRPGDAASLVAKVLNGEGALCVEVRASYAPV
ncbi:MAG TPA: MaoC/PaaZ C-terminal domain-containing protein [Bdellovibrionota bacterium]|jgi:acyl dehydratase|nr:MaoC/PaaZ C-terminal domain-containing protein [Bdellovibrionota bacterium]